MAVMKKKGNKGLPPISTASLPDVIFMILFFFMVSTTMRDQELLVRYKLPEATEVQKLEKKSLVSYIHIGQPSLAMQAKFGTAPRIQLNDSYKTTKDILDFVAAERDKLSEADRASMTICLKADALEKPPMGIGTFDLIVSNPPYVASMDILTLDSSVRDYEPLGALDGGEDGLMFYRAIVRHWTQILRPGGWLMFEVGEDQAAAVMALMTEEKYTDVTALEDTAGIRRVVVGRI